MCMICLLLSSTFMLISRVPDEWPNWAKEPLCSIDAQCPTFSTCIDGHCLPFWPSVLAENKTQCHETCRHDIQLYENHFYLQTAGHFVHFLFRDQCVVAYQHTDKAAGLSVSDYESQCYRAILQREKVSENWILALCTAVDRVSPVIRPLPTVDNRARTPLHTTLNRTTIDVVIPWVNYSSGYHENEKIPFDFGEPLFNIISTVGLKRPPWSEICWTVRSILFYGSQYIRNVYIVYNSYRHAAPDCHFGDNVIAMPQQVFLKGTILEGLSSPRPHAVFPFFHRIKSLSDYFLFSMDDIFLLKPFNLDTFYDSNSHQILTHMTGGIQGISAGSYESNMALERIFGRPGQFSDGLHVPFLVKKKSQEDMMHSLSFLFSKCSEPKHLCDFGIQYQTLIQNYMVLSGTARNSAATIGFSEIHTNGQTNLKQALHYVSATWLNVQGTGVSDEYDGTKSARIRLRTVFDSWLIKQPFYHVSKSIMKIAVAIPTYNRAGYVQLCAAALDKTIPSNDVWIFDDHSTEYTAGDLKKWFRTKKVQQNTEHQKADKQARHILEWFITTDYDWLVTLDSDLIVHPDWLELLRGMLPRTQGVVSLYHSGNPNHLTLTCDNSLCEMQSLGNAGIVWSKVLATKMLSEMSQSDGFDWGWTEWLRKQKIPQYAAKDSLVLHVGMHGTWGADSKREKSVGFDMSRLTEGVRQKAEAFLRGDKSLR